MHKEKNNKWNKKKFIYGLSIQRFCNFHFILCCFIHKNVFRAYSTSGIACMRRYVGIFTIKRILWMKITFLNYMHVIYIIFKNSSEKFTMMNFIFFFFLMENVIFLCYWNIIDRYYKIFLVSFVRRFSTVFNGFSFEITTRIDKLPNAHI